MTDHNILHTKIIDQNVRFRRALEKTGNGMPIVKQKDLDNHLDEIKYILGNTVLNDTPLSINLCGLYIQANKFPEGDYPIIFFKDSIFQDSNFSFVSTKIFGDLSFEDVKLSRGADWKFNNVEIFGDFIFRKQVELHLNNVTIHGNSDITNNVYVKELKLCTFEGKAVFVNDKFAIERMHRCSFNGPVRFDNSQFTESIALDHTTHGPVFKAFTSFAGVSFEGHAGFAYQHFYKGVDFEGCQFHKKAFFHKTVFDEEVNFSNAVFKNKTIFEACIFRVPPYFHDTVLHRNTSFYNAEFIRAKTYEDWQAYRTLRDIMIKHKKSEEEGMFFALAQRSLASVHIRFRGHRVEGILSILYDIFADYGQSIFRPLIILVVISFFFCAIWYIPAMNDGIISVNSSHIGEWKKDINPALGLTLQSIFNPLSIFGKLSPYVVSKGWLAVTSGIHSFLSIILLALTLVAIRRRFRKGTE